MSQQPVYEMQWDCKYCGTNKLLGKSQRFCPVCGAAQDPATRYFPSDDEKIAVQDHVYVGADRICSACSATNSASSQHCTQCGAPLETAASAGILQDDSQRKDGEKFTSSGPRDVAKERMMADLGQMTTQAASARKTNPLLIVGVVVAIAAVIGLVSFLMSTTSSSFVVTGHSWTRTISIEDYGPRSESAWRDSVPADGYGLSCTQRQRDTRRIPDGEDCTTRRIDQGDGTYREERQCQPRYREEPIYDSWCSYTVNRWAYARQVESSGQNMSQSPAWPDTRITRSGSCAGCERESGRDEAYIVQFRDSQGNRTVECRFDQTAWASYRLESTWTMEVRRTGQPLCDTLQPAA